MTCDDYFANALTRLQDEQRYRVFVEIERIAGHCPFCGLAIASRPEKNRDLVFERLPRHESAP
jgi:hypothetical protein